MNDVEVLVGWAFCSGAAFVLGRWFRSYTEGELRERVLEVNEEWTGKVQELQREAAAWGAAKRRLEIALGFYAARENWELRPLVDGAGRASGGKMAEAVVFDQGARARMVLGLEQEINHGGTGSTGNSRENLEGGKAGRGGGEEGGEPRAARGLEDSGGEKVVGGARVLRVMGGDAI